MIVTLTPQEMFRVWTVVKRNERIYEDRPNGHGAAPDGISFEDEIGGMGGELAAAKFLDVQWNAERTTNTHIADIGEYTQVRTLTRPSSKRLLVRPYDLEKYGNVPFILVRRDSHCEFSLLGWILGNEIFVRGLLSDGGNPTRPPVYLVDRKMLNPLHELKIV